MEWKVISRTNNNCLQLFFREPILGTAVWANDNIVCAIWLNRIQNKAELSCCDATNSVCDTVSFVVEHSWLTQLTLI